MSIGLIQNPEARNWKGGEETRRLESLIFCRFYSTKKQRKINYSRPHFRSPFQQLFGAGELIGAQDCYSFDPLRNRPLEDWPEHLVVIANHGGDPFVLDLSKSTGKDAPVATAEHGAGDWDFRRVAGSFREFLEGLAK